MELHLLLVFICLILASVVTNAALPPEIYWKSKLPNTTMPKAVKDLLSTGNMRETVYDDPNKGIHQLYNDLSNKIIAMATDELHNDPNKIIAYWQQATNDQLHYDPNKIIPSWRYAAIDQLKYDPNKLVAWRDIGTDQLQNDPNKIIAYWRYVSPHQLLDDSSKFLFFFENKLHPGEKLEMLFIKSPYSTFLIPREVVDTVPFSLNKVLEILEMFSLVPGSKEAQIIESTIHHCEEPPKTKGEEMRCVTSLESMIDYITSKLGKNVKAYSTEVEKENQLQTYTIGPGVKKISDEVMACHQRHYPYAVFHCHKLGGSSRAYFVPLEGSDGTRVKAIVVCHLDTSDWDANHLALKTLNIKPGTAPVCHFSPADNIIWVPENAT